MGTPDHVKDEVHWDAELAHKKSPPWVPCTGPGYAPRGADIGFELGCMIASMASKGELTNPRDWPIYQTKMLKPNEDFYKIQQALRRLEQSAPSMQESGVATQTAGKQ